jgi:hypothetical protein
MQRPNSLVHDQSADPGAPTMQMRTISAFLTQGCWQLAGGHGREVFDNIMVRVRTLIVKGCMHAVRDDASK